MYKNTRGDHCVFKVSILMGRYMETGKLDFWPSLKMNLVEVYVELVHWLGLFRPKKTTCKFLESLEKFAFFFGTRKMAKIAFFQILSI